MVEEMVIRVFMEGGRNALIVAANHDGKHRALASWIWRFRGYDSFDCQGALHGLSLVADIC